MVGSGVAGGGGGDQTSSSSSSRSKEAVGMMALHEALRNVCLNSDWTYSVFWTIRPRPRCRGGNGCKVGDDNGSLMLMWEDGFCRTRANECLEDMGGGDDPVRKAFSKMSIQLYNYGEGLMGKVASDKCHKWVFKEPSECEPNVSNYWQSSFDALPPEWTDQFNSGIQTIAVIQAGHGLLQLGSCKIIPEDLHFVLRMRHMFESLGYQSGFYLSQLFSSTRNTSPGAASVASPAPLKQLPTRPPPIFNWNHAHHPALSSVAPMPTPANFHPAAAAARIPIPGHRDDAHLFGALLPHASSSETHMEDMLQDHEADLKWPNGLSLFNALAGRQEDAKLLFGTEALGNKPLAHDNNNNGSGIAIAANDTTEDYLGLEMHNTKARKVDNSNKFKRSFTLPARMNSSTSASSMEHHPQQQQQAASNPHGIEYRGTEAGIYSDIMETFLE